MIEELSPQILFICGDLFDHASYDEIMRFSAEELGSIRTEYGTFFVTGNHEHYLGDMSKVLSYFEGTGIKVLRDETAMAGDIYIAGRKDIREADRIPLSKILEGTEKGSPVIVLDHQPNAIDEAAKNSVDLQLSGHTHNGQLFPFNYIVGLANHTLRYRRRWRIQSYSKFWARYVEIPCQNGKPFGNSKGQDKLRRARRCRSSITIQKIDNR